MAELGVVNEPGAVDALGELDEPDEFDVFDELVVLGEPDAVDALGVFDGLEVLAVLAVIGGLGIGSSVPNTPPTEASFVGVLAVGLPLFVGAVGVEPVDDFTGVLVASVVPTATGALGLDCAVGEAVNEVSAGPRTEPRAEPKLVSFALGLAASFDAVTGGRGTG